MTRDQIINEALRLLGEPASTGPDDPSPWVRRLNDAFDAKLAWWMADHTWTFATTVEQGALLGEAQPGWDYAFAMPAYSLRLLYVSDNARPGAYEVDHEVRGGSILTNAATVWLSYIDARAASRLPAAGVKFCEALAAILADDVHAVTRETAQTRDRLETVRRARVRDAKAHNDAGARKPDRHPGNFALARYGFRPRGYRP